MINSQPDPRLSSPISPSSPREFQTNAAKLAAKQVRDEPHKMSANSQSFIDFGGDSYHSNSVGNGSATLTVPAITSSSPSNVYYAASSPVSTKTTPSPASDSSVKGLRDVSPINSSNPVSNGSVQRLSSNHLNSNGNESAIDPSSSAQRVLKPTLLTSKPRSRSSVVPRSSSVLPRSKARQSSFSTDQPNLKPLNTHSPIAMAAAAAVTADKIKKLLVMQGPLPIRHITSHLASTITGFGELSLSKQRRLIIAVLDGPNSEFVKVGWGRWAVDNQVLLKSNGSVGSNNMSTGQSESNSGSLSSNGLAAHRQSISRQLPNSKPPLSPSLGPVEDAPVFSDSDSSDYDDNSEVEGTDDEDWRALGPSGLRQTSPREQEAIAALVQLRSN